jgi:hypothetical protein
MDQLSWRPDSIASGRGCNRSPTDLRFAKRGRRRGAPWPAPAPKQVLAGITRQPCDSPKTGPSSRAADRARRICSAASSPSTLRVIAMREKRAREGSRIVSVADRSADAPGTPLTATGAGPEGVSVPNPLRTPSHCRARPWLWRDARRNRSPRDEPCIGARAGTRRRPFVAAVVRERLRLVPAPKSQGYIRTVTPAASDHLAARSCTRLPPA